MEPPRCLTARKTRKPRIRSVIAPSEETTPMIASSRVFDDPLALEDEAELEPLPELEPEPSSEPEDTLVTGNVETTCFARSLYGDDSAL